MDAPLHGADGVRRVLVEIVAEQDGLNTAVQKFIELSADLCIGTEFERFGYLALILITDGMYGSVFQQIDNVDEGASAPETEDTDLELFHDDSSKNFTVF